MSESQSASLVDQEAKRQAEADEALKAHEAAVEKAKADGDAGTPAAEAKPAAKTSKSSGDSA
jgi:hypothetical protein